MYRSLLIVFFLLLGGISFAQNSVNTPYSSRGIGDVGFTGDAYSVGLGGAVTALTDSNQVNFFNPSTYSLIAKQLPLFSLGMNHYQRRFSNNGMKSSGQYTGITQMALAIPFANRFGAAIGLKPFSHTGYEINDHEIIQGDSIFYDYKGRGNIQELFLGFSANVVDAEKHTLSLGVQGKFYFSRISKQRDVYRVSNDNNVGGQDLKTMRASDFGFETGLMYNYRPTREHSIRIAGVYRPGANLTFIKDETRLFYKNSLDRSSYDTILAIDDIRGKVYIPSKTSVGLTYTYTPFNEDKRNAKRPLFMLAFEYAVEDWANYKEDFNNIVNTGQYLNMNSYRLGFEFKPHNVSLDRSVYINYMDKVSYRFGGYMIETPYHNNGSQLKDLGVTFGMGFPFVMGGATSTVNFSANYGVVNGKGDPTLIKDNYFGFNLGINIAPGYDRWFRKYKLD